MRLHGTARWKKLRVTWLTEHPLCVMCEQIGRTVPATVVDHIIPHRADPKLFWDIENLQSLCQPHHDSTKQRQEKSGRIIGCTTDGHPIDPNHHWHSK